MHHFHKVCFLGKKKGRGFSGQVSLRNDVKEMSLFQDFLKPHNDTVHERSKRNIIGGVSSSYLNMEHFFSPLGIATLELHERYFRKHLSIHLWSINKILRGKNLISLACLLLHP